MKQADILITDRIGRQAKTQLSGFIPEMCIRDTLYFELGDKTVFQGSFKSEGLPDVWNTRFHIDLYKAHLNPDDLETVYLPWFDRYIPVPEPLHHFSFVDFESICFEGTLSDFMVKAKSITPALAGNLTFRYAPVSYTHLLHDK